MSRFSIAFRYVTSIACICTGLAAFDWRLSVIALGGMLWFDLAAQAWRSSP